MADDDTKKRRESGLATNHDAEGRTVAMCKLDMSHCDHDFTETGDPNKDYCKKCGTSIWAWAFMEMP